MKRNIFIMACLLPVVSSAAVPTGAIEGLFSIADGKQVYFSQGNLIHQDDAWFFAEQQYDVPGANGLFAWATSGYGDPTTLGICSGIHFSGFYGSPRANYDWGVYNPIRNGGNIPGLWRTLTSEEWTYLFEHHHNEWTTIDGQAGLKVMADDGVNYLFLPAAGQMDVGESTMTETNTGYYWTSTSVGDYAQSAEAYHLTPSAPGTELLGNANRLQKMSVRLVYDAPAWLTVSDRVDNSNLLNTYKQEGSGSHQGLLMNVHVERTLTAGMSNTLTLPFDVSSDELKAICGEGFQLLQLNTAETGSINIDAKEFAVNLIPATSIEAGVPYLITPTQTVEDMHLFDRIIEVSSNDECIAGTTIDLVQLCGLIDRTHLEAGNKNYLFLYPDNTLVWPSDGDAGTMYSLRAYFRVNSLTMMSLRHLTPRMRITDYQSKTTNHKSQITSPLVSKYIRDGQLVIERNQVLYNTQGQRIL